MSTTTSRRRRRNDPSEPQATPQVTLNIRLPSELLQKIDALGASESRKRANMCRKLIIESLAARGILTDEPAGEVVPG